jgi:hypothetical protein
MKLPDELSMICWTAASASANFSGCFPPVAATTTSRRLAKLVEQRFQWSSPQTVNPVDPVATNWLDRIQ